MIKIVLTTLETQSQADGFAKSLLTDKLAACVSVSEIKASHYHWDGKVQQNKEYQLTIKTTAKQLPALRTFFKNNHPYDLPEFITLDATASQKYEAWMRSNMK